VPCAGACLMCMVTKGEGGERGSHKPPPPSSSQLLKMRCSSSLSWSRLGGRGNASRISWSTACGLRSYLSCVVLTRGSVCFVRKERDAAAEAHLDYVGERADCWGQGGEAQPRVVAVMALEATGWAEMSERRKATSCWR